MAMPRPHILRPLSSIQLANGTEVQGRMYTTIMFTRNDRENRRDARTTMDSTSGKLHGMFAQLVEALNLVATPVQVVDQCEGLLGYIAWEVRGAMMDIGRLASWDGLATVDGNKWHFAMSAKPPRGGQGTGPEKLKPSRPKAKLTTTDEFPLMGIRMVDTTTGHADIYVGRK